MASAGGAVAVATGGTGTTGTAADGIAAAQQKTAQIVQGSFPQGSILVVPHPTHPFHAVVPVFANTAVLMPQAAAAATAVASTTATASAAGAVVGSSPSASIVVSQQSTTNEKKAKSGDGEGAKVPSSVAAVAAGATQAILVQAPTTSQSLAALQASPSTVIQLSGSRNNVPAVSTAETVKEGTTPGKDRSTSSKQSSEAAAHVQQQAQKGGTTFTSPQTATIALHPSFLPQALASGMITAVPGGGIKLQDYRQALALSAMVPVMPIKVGDPVKLSTIDFESKSIEISGEVPIKTVEVDKETGELVPVTVPIKRPELEQQQQKGVAVESENALSGKEGEKSLKPKKLKAASEESHVDVEGESKKQGDDKTAKEREAAFSGHSSSEIMSAQLLLSLTGGPHKDWSAISTPPVPVPSQQQQQPADKVSDSPTKLLLTKEPSVVLTPVSLKSSGRDETASPASSTSQHMSASSGRKRKQKPIASAKPDDDSATTTPTPKGKKGGRKAKQRTVQEESAETGDTTTEAKSSSAKKKPANDKTTAGDKSTPGRSKQFSPEELLVLLDIPPSSSSSAGKSSNKNKTPTAKAKGKAKDKSNQDGRYVLQSSNATAKMEELKASRAGKPMKEYVIETDSESADSSSSGTSSSRFSPDSGSSSESSSDSSSEEGGGGGEEGSETKAKPPPKKIPARGSKGGVVRGRGGRGRGGRTQRKGEKEESSSGESSSEDDEEKFERRKKPTARARGGRARGGRGGRGPRGAGRQETTPKQQGKTQHPGHIVSIPTNLLSHKPASGKKRKVAASKTVSACFMHVYTACSAFGGTIRIVLGNDRQTCMYIYVSSRVKLKRQPLLTTSPISQLTLQPSTPQRAGLTLAP